MSGDVVYAEMKASTLAVMAKDFAQEYRSSLEWDKTTFWVDKACVAGCILFFPEACIAQDHPELKRISIRLLDKFIEKCECMCVIFTWTYLERLWCVTLGGTALSLRPIQV